MELERWIEANAGQMANDVEQLCNQCSGSEYLTGLRQMEDQLVAYFATHNVPCQRIPLADFQVINDVGVAQTQSTANALRWDFIGKNATNRKKLLLSIHYDTVYGAENGFQSCERYDVDGEARMRGPGVIDAKGGIVVLWWTLQAAIRFLDLSHVGITVVLTPDEEIGSPASIGLWRSIASEFDFAMLYEPTMPDGSFVSHRKGTGTYVIVVRGRAAHSGRNFAAGRNAIVHAARIAILFDQLNGKREGVTVNVGRIRGGDAVNVVPDLCVLRVNVRVTSVADEAWLGPEVQRIRMEMEQPDRGYGIEITGGVQSSPKEIDESTSRWIEAIDQIGVSIGQPIGWKGSGGASDGNKLARLGLPNIDTFGPEGDLLHSAQEWIRIASLPKKVRLGVATIAYWCGLHEK